METILISLAVAGKKAVIVGGGVLAIRKARLLLKTKANLTIIAPAVCAELQSLAEANRLKIIARPFQSRDLADTVLVIAATGNDHVDRFVSGAAQARNIAVNVPDRPDLSTFNMPALIDRDPIMIAISTDGTAPILGRRLRAQIEALLPTNLGSFAAFAGRFRRTVSTFLSSNVARKAFWERFFESPIMNKVLAGEEAGATRDAIALLNRSTIVGDGLISIVGAGPGDPDLLTIKALQRLQEADVIVYDQLVDAGILDRARRDAERVYAGKRRGDHGMGQDAINALLVARARRGERVVRLKGGDPFIFGRGGEEQAFAQEHGIQVEIVPGITAASGCAAAAGIPLTHRGKAAAVTFATGQGAHGIPDIDWSQFADGHQTLAIYMGVATAPEITARLIAGGLPAETPSAIIENGTRPGQRVLRSTLSALPQTLTSHQINGPAIVLIGAVTAQEQSTEHTTSHRRTAHA